MAKVLSIDDEGILIKQKSGRVYTGGEAFGRLIGYIGSITAEELESSGNISTKGTKCSGSVF
ncbi:hypothetical protein [Clostridium perfringens]|uniref:hypothetical protein n=1 Tax=Clostridium perfringens TaxID=1502 RepID=UPI002ACDD847|nr:hypothetical protein [Clostridium perfringens]